MRDALIELLGDGAAARDDLGDVERRLLVAEAVSVGVLHVVEHFGRAQQRLGRDAAPVEADSAEQFALDDRGLQPELRGADRRDIAAGARAEDDEVVSVSHWFPLRRDRPRLVLVVERDEGEFALGHDGFNVAVTLAAYRFGFQAERSAALLQQVDIDAELVADRHRAGEFDRIRCDEIALPCVRREAKEPQARPICPISQPPNTPP